MSVAIGADHAGYALKQELVASLRSEGQAVDDLGTHSPQPVDYPDVAEWVARAVLSGATERGVLICGSGVGHPSRPTSSRASAPASATTPTPPIRESSTTT